MGIADFFKDDDSITKLTDEQLIEKLHYSAIHGGEAHNHLPLYEAAARILAHIAAERLKEK